MYPPPELKMETVRDLIQSTYSPQRTDPYSPPEEIATLIQNVDHYAEESSYCEHGPHFWVPFLMYMSYWHPSYASEMRPYLETVYSDGTEIQARIKALEHGSSLTEDEKQYYMHADWNCGYRDFLVSDIPSYYAYRLHLPEDSSETRSIYFLGEYFESSQYCELHVGAGPFQSLEEIVAALKESADAGAEEAFFSIPPEFRIEVNSNWYGNSDLIALFTRLLRDAHLLEGSD